MKIIGLSPCLILLFCSICSAQGTSSTTSTKTQTATSTTTPTSRGTAIGQTINAAITAALPAVSAVENVIAAIFKKPASAVSPTDTTKVSAASLTSAVKQSADPTVLAAASQTQLAALQSAITEIATVNVMATNAQTASASLIAARALLAIPNWSGFKTQWGVAKENLTKLLTTDPEKLGKISDESVFSSWNTLSTQYNQLISDVDNYSTAKNQYLTLASFDRLSASVQALAQIPSVELQLISNQLQTVKAQPATGNNAPPPPPIDNNPLSTFIKNTIPTS
jgi:hypothetical protein